MTKTDKLSLLYIALIIAGIYINHLAFQIHSINKYKGPLVSLCALTIIITGIVLLVKNN